MFFCRCGGPHATVSKPSAVSPCGRQTHHCERRQTTVPTRLAAVVRLALTGFAAASTFASATAQDISLAATLAPTGKLRAALIVSNPVLVTRRTDGSLGGVSVVVASTLAAHLGVPIELKPYDNPARYNESLASDD
jgi:hypothetical protein